MAESIVNPIGRNVDKVVQNVYNSLPIGNQRRQEGGKVTHHVPVDPAEYSRIVAGFRKFLVRDTSKDYQPGDHVLLMEFDPTPVNPTSSAAKGYTGSDNLEYIVGNVEIIDADKVAFSLLDSDRGRPKVSKAKKKVARRKRRLEASRLSADHKLWGQQGLHRNKIASIGMSSTNSSPTNAPNKRSLTSLVSQWTHLIGRVKEIEVRSLRKFGTKKREQGESNSRRLNFA
jgi:hypothetical protein